MSTLAAGSLNRDVIYVGRSDLQIDASGIVVPADVTVDVSPKATTGPAGSVRLRATRSSLLTGWPTSNGIQSNAAATSRRWMPIGHYPQL